VEPDLCQLKKIMLIRNTAEFGEASNLLTDKGIDLFCYKFFLYLKHK
jgi:hypothetical protein